jgi:hypothetical protein
MNFQIYFLPQFFRVKLFDMPETTKIDEENEI